MSTTAATHAAPVPQSSSKGLRIALWIVQVLLALAFTGAGLTKLLTPIAELAANMDWVNALPGLVRFIGAAEFLGAVGLILPALTRIKPGLTPLAAAGLTVVMLLAAPFHLSRGEIGAIVPNLILGTLAAFVAWGRFKKAPIAPR
jgi:putative oxidoreductase